MESFTEIINRKTRTPKLQAGQVYKTSDNEYRLIVEGVDKLLAYEISKDGILDVTLCLASGSEIKRNIHLYFYAFVGTFEGGRVKLA